MFAVTETEVSCDDSDDDDGDDDDDYNDDDDGNDNADKNWQRICRCFLHSSRAPGVVLLHGRCCNRATQGHGLTCHGDVIPIGNYKLPPIPPMVRHSSIL
ncbi:hypothetical protein M0802_015477 [Mischocyttarus mexicanus]|nr:hypothetical protein M0802_015477 [Mischocyttarus mexicanus]